VCDCVCDVSYWESLLPSHVTSPAAAPLNSRTEGEENNSSFSSVVFSVKISDVFEETNIRSSLKLSQSGIT